MRIAAEAIDDGLVLELEIVVVARCVFAKKGFGVSMNRLRFAVHPWQEQEGTLVGVEYGQRAGTDRFLRQRQRHAVLGEGLRRTAPDIARELIEHDDLGKTPLHCRAPCE